MTQATNPERGIDSVMLLQRTLNEEIVKTNCYHFACGFLWACGGNVFNPSLCTTPVIPHHVLFSSPSIQCHGENVKNANMLGDHNLIYSDSGLIPGDVRVVHESSSCSYNSNARIHNSCLCIIVQNKSLQMWCRERVT